MAKLSDTIIDGIDNKINGILPQSPEATRRRKQRILIPLGIAALSAIGVGVTIAGYEAFEHWNNTPPPGPVVLDNHNGFDQDLDNGTIHINVPDSQDTNH